MIRISKDRVLENFFIDDNGVITNKEGEIQKISYYGGERPYFKSVKVHKIQMWTKYGWRDGHIWAIHHIDEDKSNNAISNLVFMTRSEHISLHTKDRMPWNKGKPPWNKGLKLTEEYRKKLSKVHKGRSWFNDGVKEHLIFPEDALPHYQKGRLKWKK